MLNAQQKMSIRNHWDHQYQPKANCPACQMDAIRGGYQDAQLSQFEAKVEAQLHGERVILGAMAELLKPKGGC